MSNSDGKNPILTFLAILTAFVGLVTGVYQCMNTAGQGQPNTNTNTNTNTKVPEPKSKTNVTIYYSGDSYGCVLDLTFKLDAKTYKPDVVANTVVLSDIPTGSQKYEVFGLISCPMLGNYNAFGDGNLTINENAKFAIKWQSTSVGNCKITLEPLQ